MFRPPTIATAVLIAALAINSIGHALATEASIWQIVVILATAAFALLMVAIATYAVNVNETGKKNDGPIDMAIIVLSPIVFPIGMVTVAAYEIGQKIVEKTSLWPLTPKRALLVILVIAIAAITNAGLWPQVVTAALAILLGAVLAIIAVIVAILILMGLEFITSALRAGRKPRGTSTPKIIWTWIKAKKEKVCPRIEFVEP